MDIRDWPLDRIMQLPDHCFGRRWPIGLQATLLNAEPVFDISEFALPERCVIWEVVLVGRIAAFASVELCLALGDQLPPDDAAFAVLELVFGGVESAAGVRGAIETPTLSIHQVTKLRVPLQTSGRRFVGRFIRREAMVAAADVIIVVSSIPREVPDCLLSV